MDFNGGEIVLLLVLAIVLFGPEKLPELARKSARLLHHFRRIANDARGQLHKHLGPDAAADLNDVAGELRGARTSLDDALSADGPGAETELAEDDEDPVEV